MTTHPSRKAGNSQCDLVLRTLEDSPGEWISMTTLARLSGAYAVHSRISDLRKKRGLNIEHKNIHAGAAIHSYYKLES